MRKTEIVDRIKLQMVKRLQSIHHVLDTKEELQEIMEAGELYEGIMVSSTDKNGHFHEEYRVTEVNKGELSCYPVGETTGFRTMDVRELSLDELSFLYDAVIDESQGEVRKGSYAELLTDLMSYEPYHPENSDKDEKGLIWSDFLEEAKGNIWYALLLRQRVEWEHPSVLVEQDQASGEYKDIYLLEIEDDIHPKELVKVDSEDELDKKKEECIDNDPDRKNGQYGVFVYHTGEIEVNDI